MPKVEMFFDHTCPYCYKGHRYLKELLPKFPDIEIVWKPVEAHPKVEEPEHLPYEDLAVQGQLFVRAHGGDELTYLERVYHVYFEENRAPDDITVLAECAEKCSVNVADFEQALRSGKYDRELQEANDYAYETQKVWAVPTFICNAENGKPELRLDAVPGVGITQEQLETFLHICADLQIN